MRRGCGAVRCDAAELVRPSPRGAAPEEEGELLSVCRVQAEEGRGGGLRRTHRFVLPRRMCGGSGIMRECSTSSTAFCTQFRTTSCSFCASVRPSPLEDEVGLGTREPDAPNMLRLLACSPLGGRQQHVGGTAFSGRQNQLRKAARYTLTASN